MKKNWKLNKQSFQYKAHLFLLLLLITVGSVHLNATDFKREYTGNTTLTASDLINLETSHCSEMIITTTDANTASFKVTLIFSAGDNGKDFADKVFDEVEFKIDKNADGIKMDLDWPFRSFSTNNKLISGESTKVTMQNGKKFEYNGKLEVKMIAEVSIPKENELNVEGKHSTIQLGHMSNVVDLEMSHSTINANDVKGVTLDASHSTVDIGNIELSSTISLSHSRIKGLKMKDAEIFCSHSNLTFIESGNTKVQLSHSNLDIDKSGNLTLTSVQHSDIEIESAKDVIITSTQHSTIDIEEAANVEVKNGQHGKIAVNNLNSFKFNTGGFTQIHIGTVKEYLEIDTQHSNIVIDKLLKDIKSVEIENQFASVTLGVKNISNYDVYIDDVKNTTVKTTGDVVKKADGFYSKRKDSGNVLDIKLSCGHCTINIE